MKTHHKHRVLRTAALAAALLCAPLYAAETAGEAQSAAGDRYVLPAPDLNRISKDGLRKGRPYEYGLIVPHALTGLTTRHGHWESLDKDLDRWTWSLTSPGAQALELQFSTLQLPPSATLTIYGEDKQFFRSFSAEDVSRRRFRSPLSAGQSATLVLEVAASERDAVLMDLESATHVYRAPFGDAGVAKSGSCNVDIACNTANGWQNQIASVVMYTFPLDGGSTVSCTGTLMGNTSGDNTPYLLTANHCVDTEAEANDATVYWNYESQYCRTPGSVSSGTPLTPHGLYSSHSQTDATLRAEYTPTDTSLMELDALVSKYAMPFFAGWSRSSTAPTSTVSIHHPAGASLIGHEKRFTRDLQAPTVSAQGGATGSGTTYWRIGGWNEGTTEGGSSGAALFNPSGQVIGQLWGGDAACGNSDPDWFGRLSVAWNGGGIAAARLSDWLDPLGSNPTSLNGYYKATPTIQQSIANLAIPDLDQLESTIAVVGQPGNGGSSSRVKVRLNHTHVGDLIVELEAPDGDTYILHNNTGGANDNLHKTYTRNLSGSPKNGVWTLRISDTAGGDVGMLDYWSIQF